MFEDLANEPNKYPNNAITIAFGIIILYCQSSFVFIGTLKYTEQSHVSSPVN